MTKTAFTAIAVALLALPIPKITEQLDELTTDQLTELRALENAEDGQQRSTLNKLIDAKLAELAAPDNPAAEKDPAPTAGKDSAAGAGAPAWQAEDYSGPLTGDQALWRVKHRPRFEDEAVTK